jgi:N-acetyl-anhydromuramyl-L-alanine amidase AmpD
VTLPYVPAAAHGGPLTKAAFVVIHCTESDNAAGTAEALAGPGWFGGPKAGTSAHRIFDRDSGVEMVRVSTVAYHAGPGGNSYGRSYELCGRASWSAEKWREEPQLAMLRAAAPYIAADLRDLNAPARWLSVAQVAARAGGMCTHNDVRLALGGTTHSDPGPNFPYAELLEMVQQALTDPEDLDMDAATFKRLVWEVITQPDVVEKIAAAVVNHPLSNPAADPRPGATYSLAQRLPAIDATVSAKLAGK